MGHIGDVADATSASSPMRFAYPDATLTIMHIDRTVSSVRRLAAGAAFLAALGLAVAHLTVNLERLPSDVSVGLLLGWVLLPSALAVVLALAALQAGLQAAPGRLVRLGTVSGAVVLSLLLVVSAVLTVVTGTLVILRPDGPGLWAIIGAPAFTTLSIMIGPRQSRVRGTSHA